MPPEPDDHAIIEARKQTLRSLEAAIEARNHGRERGIAAAARDYVKAFDAWDRRQNRDETEQGGVPRPAKISP